MPLNNDAMQKVSLPTEKGLACMPHNSSTNCTRVYVHIHACIKRSCLSCSLIHEHEYKSQIGHVLSYNVLQEKADCNY